MSEIERALSELENDNARLRQIFAQKLRLNQTIIPNAETIFKEQEELLYKGNSIYKNMLKYGLNDNLQLDVLTKEAVRLRQAITSINKELRRVKESQRFCP